MPTTEQFARFKTDQDAFMGSGNAGGVANKPVTWQHVVSPLENWGEEVDRDLATEERSLLALIQYNAFRAWPLNKDQAVGEEDRQNLLMYLNIQYLTDQGWINSNNQFTFNPGLDRFIIDGIPHKASGDTPVSLNHDTDLHIIIVLKRDEGDSGSNINMPDEA